jgi:hypothetical protein
MTPSGKVQKFLLVEQIVGGVLVAEASVPYTGNIPV